VTRGCSFRDTSIEGQTKGDVLWNDLEHSSALWILHHPRYAGAFCFGRTHTRRHPDGRHAFVRLAPEEWTALIHDAHEGYIRTHGRLDQVKEP
jgi:hypothetical protein